MIVKGKFSVLSMAIYGEVVTDTPSPANTYKPSPVSSLGSIPLSPALDPANSNDPTLLAKQLLTLIPEAPPLPLVVRLIFCLKPPHDDWNLPGFPYLHADLDRQIEEDPGLESITQAVSRPVQDDVTDPTLLRFGARVAACPKVCQHLVITSSDEHRRVRAMTMLIMWPTSLVSLRPSILVWLVRFWFVNYPFFPGRLDFRSSPI